MTDLAIVLFGDVVDSRLDGPASTRWLRSLSEELADAYPLEAVLRATLREPEPPGMRWAISAGRVERGDGPATQWTGDAFVAARQLIERARRRRDRLVARSGDDHADALLDDVAPVLGALLERL